MTKILVSDKLSKEGLEILESSGFPVVMKPGMTEDELCAEIVDYDALIIRSGTTVTPKVIDAAKKLRLIGRAGVGVDNVDIPYASEKGILVMNTPDANTVSAAEHTVAMIMALARNIPFAHASMHEGKWDRSKFTGVELNGKTLGVIGTGRVGGEVIKRLKAFNMTVIGYDPYIPQEVADRMGIRLTTLEEVLKESDFISIHTPLLPSTRGMVGLDQFKMMKPTARLANVARGGIVDEDALYTALKEKIIAGAAFDVWCSEPLSDDEKKLLELDNLVTTPHLGASTTEAQERVAIDIAQSAVKYLRDGVITNAINAPRGKLSPETAPYVPLAEGLGEFLCHANGDRPVDQMEVIFRGGLASMDVKLLTVSAVKGFIKGIIGKEGANLVNAMPVAKSRGMEVKETKTEECADYANLIEIRTRSGDKVSCVRGTVFGEQPRLVNYDGYAFNLAMSGHLVFLRYPDTTGVIGKLGTAFGDKGVSIISMAVSVKEKTDEAMMVLEADKPITPELLDTAAKACNGSAKYVDLN